MGTLALLGLALCVAISLFTLTWALSTRWQNYGFLDVIWSLSIGILSLLFAVLGSGDWHRKWLFATAACVWSFRLGIYILIRVWRHHPQEDKRYATLRQRWPTPFRFLWFFELQAMIGVLFSLPFLLAIQNERPDVGNWEVAGLLVALCSVGGEAIADWQAQRWKNDPAHRNALIQTGLWRWSRHPNYFFEFLVWIGFCLAAVSSPFGWVTVVCPASMLYFLLCVTGIPLSEKHSVESRGEAYREYQRTTSRFIPWPPKR